MRKQELELESEICLIKLKRPTRERLKDVSTRRQTYDDIINELLKLKEQKFQDE